MSWYDLNNKEEEEKKEQQVNTREYLAKIKKALRKTDVMPRFFLCVISLNYLIINYNYLKQF